MQITAPGYREDHALERALVVFVVFFLLLELIEPIKHCLRDLDRLADLPQYVPAFDVELGQVGSDVGGARVSQRIDRSRRDVAVA